MATNHMPNKKFGDIRTSPHLAEAFADDLVESYRYWENNGKTTDVKFTHLYDRMGKYKTEEEGKAEHGWTLPGEIAGNKAFRDYCQNIGLIKWHPKGHQYIAKPTQKMRGLIEGKNLKNTITDLSANHQHPSNFNGYNPSLAERQKIERIAVETTENDFLNRGYTVISTEADNCGWDLECKKDGELLHVEVKGTQASVMSFELTPNEFEKLKANIDSYRISMVINCLADPEHIEIFLFKFSLPSDSAGPLGQLIGICEKTGRKIILNPVLGARGKDYCK